MKSLLRPTLFILILTAWYFGLFLGSIPFLIFYSYKYNPYELVLIGFLIDIQFTTFGQVPFYSLFSIFWLGVTIWLKPQLSVYTDKL